MGGFSEAPIRRPAVANEHAVEVRPQQVGGLRVAPSGLSRVDGRLRRGGRSEPPQVAADLPPGLVGGDDGAVADLAQQFGIGQLGPAGGPMHGADQAARTAPDAVVLPQQRGDLAERQPHLLVEDDRRRHQPGTQLHGGGPQRVGGLQPMAALHPQAAVLTGPEGDSKLTDGDPLGRQFFLELGGHARRADSSTATRTARRQRCVVVDVDPCWPAPARRLAVLRPGSTAERLGLGGEGLAEGATWRYPARLAASSSRLRRVFCFSSRSIRALQPFGRSRSPSSRSRLRLASFELALRPVRAPLASAGARPACYGPGVYLAYRNLCIFVHPERQPLPGPSAPPPEVLTFTRGLTDPVTNLRPTEEAE